MKKENLMVAYGNENMTLNKGENHIMLNKEETAFLIKSLLNNTRIENINLN